MEFWIFGFLGIWGFIFLVKTGTVGTGTDGRRNWPEGNRTVGFLLIGTNSERGLKQRPCWHDQLGRAVKTDE